VNLTKKIAVVGGGYGGIELIRQLLNRGIRNVEVELFSSRRWFENTIGGPELLSERAELEGLRYSLEELSRFWNFKLHVKEVRSVDLEDRLVYFDGGALEYDVVALASGSQTNFYDVEGALNALPAYNLEDFVKINRSVKALGDGANIVVVGAGFVGLEVVGSLLDLLESNGKRAKIQVVELASSVLSAYPNELARSIAFEYFSKKGVRFLLGQRVKALERDRVVLANRNVVQADAIIWAAGVRSSSLAFNVRGAKLYNGYIKVDEMLLVEGREDAFALGDVAHVDVEGRLAQKMAGEALEQARTVAKNMSLIVEGGRADVRHKVSFPVDFPQALLSVGGGKAILVYGQNYASIGEVEYFLKKRIDFDEIMERFP